MDVLSYTDDKTIICPSYFIDCINTDIFDSDIKKINVYWLCKINFLNLIVALFTVYGTLWKYIYESFDKICKSWYIAIRALLRLPFSTRKNRDR